MAGDEPSSHWLQLSRRAEHPPGAETRTPTPRLQEPRRGVGMAGLGAGRFTQLLWRVSKKGLQATSDACHLLWPHGEGDTVTAKGFSLHTTESGSGR